MFVNSTQTPVVMRLRERIIESRRNVFNITLAEVEKRKQFETAVSYNYFSCTYVCMYICVRIFHRLFPILYFFCRLSGHISMLNL